MYIYLGDRFTDQKYKRQICTAVLHDGKCIRGRNGNMLVQFLDGHTVVVMAKLLRKIK